MANKQITPESWEEYPQDTDGETIPNKERGCGYLKAGSAYVRADPQSFSKGGVLPAFVILADDEGNLDPIPYKESLPRGYETIAGTSFAIAAESHRNFLPIWNGGKAAFTDSRAAENMVNAGAYDSVDAVPASETQRHIDFLAIDGLDGEHWGEIPQANAKDLMMRAGKSYYEEPWDFIDEAVDLGLNKGISVHDNKRPPTVVPGRTRCWIIHPNACGKDMPGVVGFAYLTRTIFTRDKDGKVPNHIQEYSDSGQIDVVNVGQPEPLEDDDERDYDDIAEAHQSLDEFDPDEGEFTGSDEGTFTGRLQDAPETVSSTTEAVHTAISESMGSGEPVEIDPADLERADLGELAGIGWKAADHPPAAHDVLEGGDVLGIIVQDDEPRTVVRSNNFTFDEEARMGHQRSGPYTVEVEVADAGRQIRVVKG